MQRYNKKTTEAIGDWLRHQEWSHFVTFTTGYTLTSKSARRAMHRIHNSFDKQAPCTMFWASEPFDLKDGCHTHALVKVHSEMTFKTIHDLWQKASGGTAKNKNRIDIQVYNSELGAGHYLSKYITKTLSDYDYLTPGSSANYSLKRI
jgi:hypothetical protein